MKQHKLFSLLSTALLGVCLLLALASCKVVDRADDPIGACAHDWQDAEMLVPATCTAAGSQLQNCTKCGESRTMTVAALGHSFGEMMTQDQEEHWLACTRNGCNEIKD